MHKLIAVNLFVLILLSNCYYHTANSMRKEKGKNAGSRIDHIITSVPIKLQFRDQFPDGLKIEQKYSYDSKSNKDRKIIIQSLNENMLKNYYSIEILSQFQGSNIFQFNSDSNIIIKIKPEVRPVKDVIENSVILSTFTFFIVPMQDESTGIISFELLNSSNQSIIKKYDYQIQHNSYIGISSLFLGFLFPIFDKTKDHSTNEKTFAIMRAAFQTFEEDIAYDLSRDKEFAAKFFIKSPPNYEIQILSTESIEIDSHIPLLRTTLESVFIDRGFRLMESSSEKSRGKIQRTITVSDVKWFTNNLDKEEVNFNLECNDIETNETLWKEKIYPKVTTSSDIKNSIESELYKVLSELRLKGKL